MVLMESMRLAEASPADGAMLFVVSVAVDGGQRGCGLSLSWVSASMRWRTCSRPSQRQEPLYYVQVPDEAARLARDLAAAPTVVVAC